MTRVSNGVELPDDAPLRIDTITAYIAYDEDDHAEGIPAFQTFDGTWMPMVGADTEMIQSLRPHAERVAREHNTKVSLVRFSTREVLVEDILAETTEETA